MKYIRKAETYAGRVRTPLINYDRIYVKNMGQANERKVEHTHTHTHARTHARTHAHTHTHTPYR